MEPEPRPLLLRKPLHLDDGTLNLAEGVHVVLAIGQAVATITHYPISYEYDARSRLRTAEGPAWRTEFDYDARDALVEQHEPGGVTTRFRIGAHGDIEETLVDPGGLDIRSRWAYDEASRLVRYTDPAGERTTWDRDALGRVRRTQLGDGSTWLREYDRAGRIAVQTMPSGSRVHFEYAGPAASPSRVSVAGAAALEPVATHTFVYDALERLIRADTPVSAVERRYDSLGRTIQETALGGTVRTEHHVAAQSLDSFFPDGRCERTEHDALGRPVRVVLQTPGALGGVAGAELVRVEYTGMSSPKRVTCGNGVETTCVYDDASRLVRLDLFGPHRRTHRLRADTPCLGPTKFTLRTDGEVLKRTVINETDYYG